MTKDAKQKIQGEIKKAQVKVDRAQDQIEQARSARRETFARARAAGLSLAEIDAAEDLHRSRVDQILQGK